MSRITDRADRVIDKVFKRPSPQAPDNSDAGKVLGDFLAQIRSKKASVEEVKKGVM